MVVLLHTNKIFRLAIIVVPQCRLFQSVTERAYALVVLYCVSTYIENVSVTVAKFYIKKAM